MKDILIIFAHPDNKSSVNSCILDTFISGIKKQNATYSLVDLYEEKFNPVFTIQELRSGLILDNIKKYHSLISKHRKMVFICPAWNYGIPAILKGWIDRVLVIPGFSFQEDENHLYQGGLLQHEKVLLIQTFGGYFDVSVEKEKEQLEYYLSPVEAILNFCGIKNIEKQHFFGLYSAEKAQKNINNIQEKTFDLGFNF